MKPKVMPEPERAPGERLPRRALRDDDVFTASLIVDAMHETRWRPRRGDAATLTECALMLEGRRQFYRDDDKRRAKLELIEMTAKAPGLLKIAAGSPPSSEARAKAPALELLQKDWEAATAVRQAWLQYYPFLLHPLLRPAEGPRRTWRWLAGVLLKDFEILTGGPIKITRGSPFGEFLAIVIERMTGERLQPNSILEVLREERKRDIERQSAT